jgi:small-conductance mechanosensitive channel
LSGLEGMGLDPVEIQTLFPDDDRFGDLFQDVEPELSTMPEVKATLDEIEAEKDAEVEANRAVRQAERQAGQAAEQSAEERAVEQAAAAADVKARRKELGAALDKANAADFYITIVAVDGDQAGAVLRAIGETDMGARFISAAKVLGALSAK